MSPLRGDHQTELLRAIPSVEALLQRPCISELLSQMGRSVLVDHVRSVLEQVRGEILTGTSYTGGTDLIREIEGRIVRRTFDAGRPSLRRVVNATGVVIHTNLGRSPLAEEAVRALVKVARGYTNLEYDVTEGRRGRREVHCEALLRALIACEAAVVVNNNAAAVLLVLNTLAEGGEVIVSRGELVEIGGSFRIPEIMAKSNAVLREVGTTNRTRINDYAQAICEQTRVLLRVHRSNFRITGFTEQPALEDLIALGREHGIPCYQDLGSGCMTDLRSEGIVEEPLVQRSLAMGVDLCSFSGDKLLGGPQAGIIVGKKELIDQLSRNPLMRTLRPDKLAFAALEATLQLYRRGLAQCEVPALRMVSMTAKSIARRARSLVRRARRTCLDGTRFELKSGFSVIGGGAAPGAQIETLLIVVEHAELSAVEIEKRLRAFDPPIIGRIEEDGVVLDLRTVQPDEEKVLLAAFQSFTGDR